jgi:hypothetical protein
VDWDAIDQQQRESRVDDQHNHEDELHTRDMNDRRRVTPLRWIRERVQMRADFFNYLHYAGVLSQEYLIDFWAQIGWARLRYIHQNQVRLRAHKFADVAAAARAGRNANDAVTQSNYPPDP